MNPAEYLRDDESSIFRELIQTANNKEIVLNHCLTFLQLSLSLVEIKVYVKRFHKFRDGIFVGFLGWERAELMV